MSKVLVNDATLTAIAEAIREKLELEDTYKPAEMPNAILSIEGGGGSGGDLPEEAFTLTGDCSYRFAFNGWNWFIDNYGHRVKTENITDMRYMFYSTPNIARIPFEINYITTESAHPLNQVFQDCTYLEEAPKINFIPKLNASSVGSYNYASNLNYFFSGCTSLTKIDYDYFNNMFGEEYGIAARAGTGSNFARSYLFNNCESLRRLPDLSRVMTGATGNNCFYKGTFSYCACLDEIVNLPLHTGSPTSNMFSDTFVSCNRLKRLTFETQADGTPYTRSWSSQTINLTDRVGYGIANPYTNPSWGLTTKDCMMSDATYQALKDSENCYAMEVEYSRYNKTSALETIATLPDVSSKTGNTIKFEGAAGSKTDGGAINTMTEEEIAVATAKGWTVSFV